MRSFQPAPLVLVPPHSRPLVVRGAFGGRVQPRWPFQPGPQVLLLATSILPLALLASSEPRAVLGLRALVRPGEEAPLFEQQLPTPRGQVLEPVVLDQKGANVPVIELIDVGRNVDCNGSHDVIGA